MTSATTISCAHNSEIPSMTQLSSVRPVDTGDTHPIYSTGFSTRPAHNRMGYVPLQIVTVVVPMSFSARHSRNVILVVIACVTALFVRCVDILSDPYSHLYQCLFPNRVVTMEEDAEKSFLHQEKINKRVDGAFYNCTICCVKSLSARRGR